MHAVAEKLASLIQQHGWEENLLLAIEAAQTVEMPGVPAIRYLNEFLRQVSGLVTYTPSAGGNMRSAHPRA